MTRRVQLANLSNGNPLDALFVHSWTLSGEKIVAFQQNTDTTVYASLIGQ